MTRRGKHWMVRLLCTRQNASTIDAPTYAELVEGLKDQHPTSMQAAWNCGTAVAAARMAFGTVHSSVVCKPVTLKLMRSDRQRLAALENPEGWVGFQRRPPPERGWREIPLGAPTTSPGVVPDPQGTPWAPRTPQVYVAAQGRVCPVCLHTDSTLYGPVYRAVEDSDEVLQGVRCTHCRATWSDVYTLSSYRDLDLSAVPVRWRT